MTRTWTWVFRGGPWDRRVMEGEIEPRPMVWVWECDGRRCVGHMSWNVDALNFEELARAVAYRLEHVDEDVFTAVYEIGDLEPGDPSDMVGVGANLEPWTVLADLELRAPVLPVRVAERPRIWWRRR